MVSLPAEPVKEARTDILAHKRGGKLVGVKISGFTLGHVIQIFCFSPY